MSFSSGKFLIYFISEFFAIIFFSLFENPIIQISDLLNIPLFSTPPSPPIFHLSFDLLSRKFYINFIVYIYVYFSPCVAFVSPSWS